MDMNWKGLFLQLLALLSLLTEKCNTPLDGFYSPFITVSRDGVPVQYEGIIAHYAPFSKNKFVPLRVGENIIATVQHTDAFTFSSDGNLCSSIAGYIRR